MNRLFGTTGTPQPDIQPQQPQQQQFQQPQQPKTTDLFDVSQKVRPSNPKKFLDGQ